MRAFLITVPLILLLSAGLVRAQEQAEDAVVRDRGRRAVEAFSQGEYAKALKLFEVIEPLLTDMPNRRKELGIVRFNLARCLDELGARDRAYLAYLRSLTAELPDELRAKVKARVAVLKPPEPGRILTICDAKSAQILVRGDPTIRRCGEEWALPAGDYILDVKAGGGDQVIEITVISGELVRATVSVTDTPPPPPPPSRALAWSLTSGAAALLVSGVIINRMAQNAVDESNSAFNIYKNSSDNVRRERLRVEIDSLNGDAQTLGMTSYVLMGISAAVAGGAVWAWLYEPDPGAAISVTPGGVWIRGSF